MSATGETPREPTIEDVREAARRIVDHVRRTPSVAWVRHGVSSLDGVRVTLKLEQLQVGGSFKARGAVNKLAASPFADLKRGVVTASGGNHGIGVAWAAARFDAPATVFLPENAPASSEKRLRHLGATTERAGSAWDDAWAEAVRFAGTKHRLLVHPFEDPLVVAGQGTVALELLEDAPDLDAIVVAVGGGGLAGGVALTAKAVRPGIKVFGVEPTGATSMQASLRSGHVVALPSVNTIAGTLAPRSVGPLTFGLARRHLDDLVLVSDDEMRAAQKLYWDELRLAVEPAGAAALAALVNGRVPLDGARHVAVIVCGANFDLGDLARAV